MKSQKLTAHTLAARSDFFSVPPNLLKITVSANALCDIRDRVELQEGPDHAHLLTAYSRASRCCAVAYAALPKRAEGHGNFLLSA